MPKSHSLHIARLGNLKSIGLHFFVNLILSRLYAFFRKQIPHLGISYYTLWGPARPLFTNYLLVFYIQLLKRVSVVLCLGALSGSDMSTCRQQDQRNAPDSAQCQCPKLQRFDKEIYAIYEARTRPPPPPNREGDTEMEKIWSFTIPHSKPTLYDFFQKI